MIALHTFLIIWFHVAFCAALNHYSSRYYADAAATQDSPDWFSDQLANVSNVNASGIVIGPVAESTW